MRLFNFFFLCKFLLFISFVNGVFSSCLAQIETKQDLKKHILYLADDKLEGRETGTNGEKLAYEYIIKQFEEIGIEPNGDNGTYLQKFDFTDGTVLGEKNSMKINDYSLKINEEYFVLPISNSGSANGEMIDVGYGISAPNLNHNDYNFKEKKLKNKVFIIKNGHPEPDNPHSEFLAFSSIDTKIDLAIEKGAKAVVIIADKEAISKMMEQYHKSTRVTTKNALVIVVNNATFDNFSSSVEKMLYIDVIIEIDKQKKIGNNVIGFIDNLAKNTIIIGGHYDHLGYGHHGSLHNGKPEIHNGADDNASGIALIIELARKLKGGLYKNHNYQFICFSGEELGLFGSSYYVKNPTIPLDQINFMINFDMIGRIDTAKNNSLVITGTGTSPFWSNLDKVDTDLELRKKESGIGPSDHTSFYLKDIPVLHFFSGAHADYHKPSDDEEKINYQGILDVESLLLALIEKSNKANAKLVFTETKEDKTDESTPRFTVGLGVIPDYLFDGIGMRIEGVRPDKTASKAGIEDGDIVVKMGDVEVTDMMSYMKALSKFKKGDSAKVIIMREEEKIEKQVTFF